MTQKQKIEELEDSVNELKAELKDLKIQFNETDFAIVNLNVGFHKYMRLFEMIYSFMTEIQRLPRHVVNVEDKKNVSIRK